MMEPPSSSGRFSDVIRFFTTTDFKNLMIFYSEGIYDNPLDEPADILMPLELLQPIGPVASSEEIGPEGNNYVLYAPMPNEPGYFPGVQYKLISDVPEPATLSLLALSVAGLVARRRSRK
jgi:hypothetical protein